MLTKEEKKKDEQNNVVEVYFAPPLDFLRKKEAISTQQLCERIRDNFKSEGKDYSSFADFIKSKDFLK